MENYSRAQRPKDPVADDEIRITSDGHVARYVHYAERLLTEKELRTLNIKATGKAIAVAILSAEVIKRRFHGLHQITKCGVTTLVDRFEPLEEGLDVRTQTRTIPFLEITLSLDALNAKDPGYQAPLPENLEDMDIESVMRSGHFRGRGGYRGRGGPRGGMRKRAPGDDSEIMQNGIAPNGAVTAAGDMQPKHEGVGNSRGGYRGVYRGRGGRGRGRGQQH